MEDQAAPRAAPPVARGDDHVVSKPDCCRAADWSDSQFARSNARYPGWSESPDRPVLQLDERQTSSRRRLVVAPGWVAVNLRELRVCASQFPIRYRVPEEWNTGPRHHQQPWSLRLYDLPRKLEALHAQPSSVVLDVPKRLAQMSADWAGHCQSCEIFRLAPESRVDHFEKCAHLSHPHSPQTAETVPNVWDRDLHVPHQSAQQPHEDHSSGPSPSWRAFAVPDLWRLQTIWDRRSSFDPAPRSDRHHEKRQVFEPLETDPSFEQPLHSQAGTRLLFQRSVDFSFLISRCRLQLWSDGLFVVFTAESHRDFLDDVEAHRDQEARDQCVSQHAWNDNRAQYFSRCCARAGREPQRQTSGDESEGSHKQRSPSQTRAFKCCFQ